MPDDSDFNYCETFKIELGAKKHFTKWKFSLPTTENTIDYIKFYECSSKKSNYDGKPIPKSGDCYSSTDFFSYCNNAIILWSVGGNTDTALPYDTG